MAGTAPDLAVLKMTKDGSFCTIAVFGKVIPTVDGTITCTGVKRVFITNVKGTFLGMSESEEASKRR